MHITMRSSYLSTHLQLDAHLTLVPSCSSLHTEVIFQKPNLFGILSSYGVEKAIIPLPLEEFYLKLSAPCMSSFCGDNGTHA